MSQETIDQIVRQLTGNGFVSVNVKPLFVMCLRIFLLSIVVVLLFIFLNLFLKYIATLLRN